MSRKEQMAPSGGQRRCESGNIGERREWVHEHLFLYSVSLSQCRKIDSHYYSVSLHDKQSHRGNKGAFHWFLEPPNKDHCLFGFFWTDQSRVQKQRHQQERKQTLKVNNVQKQSREHHAGSLWLRQRKESFSKIFEAIKMCTTTSCTSEKQQSYDSNEIQLKVKNWAESSVWCQSPTHPQTSLPTIPEVATPGRPGWRWRNLPAPFTDAWKLFFWV